MPILINQNVSKDRKVINADQLNENDKVFYSKLSKEIFTNYEDYFEHIMILNSTVWRCLISGRSNLTYAEALASERRHRKTIKDVLDNFPPELMGPMLLIASYTKCSSILKMTDEVWNYMESRFVKGETVQAIKLVDKNRVERECNIVEVLSTSPSKEAIDPSAIKYRVKRINFKQDNEQWIVPGCDIRRKRNTLSKERLKIFLQQCVQAEKYGMFKITDEAYKKYVTDNKIHKFSDVFNGTPPKFELSKALIGKQMRKEAKGAKDSQTAEDKEQKLKEIAQKAAEEAERKQKLEIARKLEHEILMKRIHSTVRDFNQIREDLELRDQRKLPNARLVNSVIPNKYFGDIVMILEFLHSFSSVIVDKQKLLSRISLDAMSHLVHSDGTQTTFENILKVLLSTIFSLELEEREEVSISYVEPNTIQMTSRETSTESKLIYNSTEAAHYSEKYFSQPLHLLNVQTTTLSEILRLHILSSGAKINDAGTRWRFQQRGGYQCNDDAGLQFLLEYPHIITFLRHKSVFELPVGEKLIIIKCLIGQILTFPTVRDIIEERKEETYQAKLDMKNLLALDRKRESSFIVAKKELMEDSKKKMEEFQGNIREKDRFQNSLCDLMRDIEMKNDREKQKNAHKLEQLGQKIFNHQMYFGSDRAFRLYWLFESLPGLFIEQSYNPGYCYEEPVKNIPGLADCTAEKRYAFISKMVRDAQSSGINNKENKIDNYMKKQISDKHDQLDTVKNDSNSKAISQHELLMCTGDGICPVHKINDINWYYLSSEEELNQLIESLNPRGIREKPLRDVLIAEKQLILQHIERCPTDKFNIINDDSGKIANGNESIENGYECMDIVLRESLLELESDISNGLLGNIKVDNRLKWKIGLQDGQYDKQTEYLEWGPNMEFCKGKTKVFKSAENSHIFNYKDPGDILTSLKFANGFKTDDIKECSEDIANINGPANQSINVSDYAAALLQIAQGIDWKFLKEPFGVARSIRIAKNKDRSVLDKAKEASNQCMQMWSVSLMNSTSLSQVFLHYEVLKKHVLWSKSAMNALCQVCRRKNDPDKMLLCDNCNGGYHTHCLKPKLQSIPEGNWYCKTCEPEMGQRKPSTRRVRKIFSFEECEENSSLSMDEHEPSLLSENASDNVNCAACSKSGRKLLNCIKCGSYWHKRCCDSIKIVSETEIYCTKCSRTSASRRSRGSSDDKSGSSDEEIIAKKIRRLNNDKMRKYPVDKGYPSNTRKSDTRNSRRVGSNHAIIDSIALYALLEEVAKRDDVWPFERPVKLQEVPDYKEIISHPMDFAKIKSKLNLGEYPTNYDIMSDIQLIFSNCDRYNNSESEIYSAGVSLEKFIQKKCMELDLPFKPSDMISSTIMDVHNKKKISCKK